MATSDATRISSSGSSGSADEDTNIIVACWLLGLVLSFLGMVLWAGFPAGCAVLGIELFVTSAVFWLGCAIGYLQKALEKVLKKD